MYRKTILAAAVTATTLAFAATHNVQAGGTACVLSAKRMSTSCLAETREEYWANLARCPHIADDDERADCVPGIKEEYKEASAECRDQTDARREVCYILDEGRYMDPLADEDISFVDPDEVGKNLTYPNNPYVIIQAGHTHVLRAEETVISEPDEEEGDPGGEEETEVEIVVVYATDEVREIEGVLCRVVVDVVVEPEFDEEEGKLEFNAVEVTDDWFAQDTQQNVYYCGEVSRNFEDGILRDLDGSFEAGVEWASGGLLTAAAPVLGMTHRQEYALGEAEDLVEYLTESGTPADDGLTDNPGFPCGAAGAGTCLQTYEFTPLEPDDGEYKYYMPGVGFVLAVPLEDGVPSDNGSEGLICTGDSLDVLFSEECGFGEDAQELLDTLCELADEFCDDGED